MELDPSPPHGMYFIKRYPLYSQVFGALLKSHALNIKERGGFDIVVHLITFFGCEKPRVGMFGFQSYLSLDLLCPFKVLRHKNA